MQFWLFCMFSNMAWMDVRLRLVDYFNATSQSPIPLTCFVWSYRLVGYSVLHTGSIILSSPLRNCFDAVSSSFCKSVPHRFEECLHLAVENIRLNHESLPGKASHLQFGTFGRLDFISTFSLELDLAEKFTVLVVCISDSHWCCMIGYSTSTSFGTSKLSPLAKSVVIGRWAPVPKLHNGDTGSKRGAIEVAHCFRSRCVGLNSRRRSHSTTRDYGSAKQASISREVSKRRCTVMFETVDIMDSHIRSETKIHTQYSHVGELLLADEYIYIYISGNRRGE